jgi:hypothetical protein
VKVGDLVKPRGHATLGIVVGVHLAVPPDYDYVTVHWCSLDIPHQLPHTDEYVSDLEIVNESR